MFVSKHKRTDGCNRHGERVARGYYMLWIQAAYFDDAGIYINGLMYAAVRHASMAECGNWMSGTFRIGGKGIWIGGSLGSDGLPISFKPSDLPSAGNPFGFSDSWLNKWFVKVPDNVIQAWGKCEGGGDGYTSSSVPAVRNFGRELYHATYFVNPLKGSRGVRPSAKAAQEWASRKINK